MGGQLSIKITIDIESQMVAGGVVKVLADAEVAFGGEDGGMAERELDLFQGGAALVGQLSEPGDHAPVLRAVAAGFAASRRMVGEED